MCGLALPGLINQVNRDQNHKSETFCFVGTIVTGQLKWKNQLWVRRDLHHWDEIFRKCFLGISTQKLWYRGGQGYTCTCFGGVKGSWRAAKVWFLERPGEAIGEGEPHLRIEGITERSWDLAPCVRIRVPKESPGEIICEYAANLQWRLQHFGDTITWDVRQGQQQMRNKASLSLEKLMHFGGQNWRSRAVLGLRGPEDGESQTIDAELTVLLEFDFA